MNTKSRLSLRQSHLNLVLAAALLLVALPAILIVPEKTYVLYSDSATVLWSVLSTALIFLVARQSLGASKRLSVAWRVFGIAILLSTLGEVSWFVYSQILDANPFPSIGDVFYFTFYPTFLVGLLLFPFSPQSKFGRLKILLETSTVAISMGLVVWIFIFTPTWDQAEHAESFLLGFLATAYPLLNILPVVALWVLLTRKIDDVEFASKIHIGFGILALFSADMLFSIQQLAGKYDETVRLNDALYILFYVFIGMAALHQLSGKSAAPDGASRFFHRVFSNLHRLFTDIFLILSFILLVADHYVDLKVDFGWFSVIVGCLILLAITLQRIGDREISHLNSQLRKLNAELEQQVEERTVRLRETNEELQKAVRARDEFMAAMQHELRTPINGILGFTEVVQMPQYGSLTEKQLKAIGNIEKSGQQLLGVVNDVIDFTTLQSGKALPDFVDCSLENLGHLAIESINSQAMAKQQRVHFSISPEKIKVTTDERYLYKLLLHLLNNASKFTPEQGEFGLEIIGNREGREVKLTVWDRGPGIQQEHLLRLFQPFVQLDASLSRLYEGTGLGLALVRQLATLLNGRVDVESVLGQGSRFIVTLPWAGSGSR